MLKNAPILLCDEATSALDYKTEVEVVESLNDLAKGRTTLMIAHRLTSVKNADKIIVLDQGRVAEEGSHDELLARSGSIYSQLWNNQLD